MVSLQGQAEQYDKFSEIKTNSGEEMQDEVRQEMEEAKPGQQQFSIMADKIQGQQLLVPDKKNLTAASVQPHSIAGGKKWIPWPADFRFNFVQQQEPWRAAVHTLLPAPQAAVHPLLATGSFHSSLGAHQS